MSILIHELSSSAVDINFPNILQSLMCGQICETSGKRTLKKPQVCQTVCGLSCVHTFSHDCKSMIFLQPEIFIEKYSYGQHV